jgi:tetratricopeptide (TPR) repeat protein
MSEEKKPDHKKALKHETKGDKLFEKEKYREALKEYQKSETFDPNRPEIYEKLIETHGRYQHEWVEQDFSDSLSWTMRRQELQNPQIKWVHETFTPEYQEIQKLIQGLMATMDPERERAMVAKILDFGPKAALPLVHFLLSLKALAQSGPPGAEIPAAEPPAPSDPI